jgi:hypothetical protein
MLGVSFALSYAAVVVEPGLLGKACDRRGVMVSESAATVIPSSMRITGLPDSFILPVLTAGSPSRSGTYLLHYDRDRHRSKERSSRCKPEPMRLAENGSRSLW